MLHHSAHSAHSTAHSAVTAVGMAAAAGAFILWLIAGYFTNASLSNAKDQNAATANLRAIAQKTGFDAPTAQLQLAFLKTKGSISQAEYDVWSSKIPLIFGNSSKV